MVADLLAELDEVPVDHRRGVLFVLLGHPSWKPQPSKEVQTQFFPGRGADRVCVVVVVDVFLLV